MKEVEAEQNLRKKKRKKFILVALLALLLIFIVIGTYMLKIQFNKSRDRSYSCRRIIWKWIWE